MEKKLLAIALFLSSALFAAPVGDNLGGVCLCDSDPNVGCIGDCDGCTPDGDPATAYTDCELSSTEDDLEDSLDLVDDDFDETASDFDDVGILGAIEGTYADYEEAYIVDADSPYTNEVDITPSWCD